MTDRLTLDEARSRHPDAAVIDVIDRTGPGGETYPAIYVWADDDEALDDDGARAEAVYWLAPTPGRLDHGWARRVALLACEAGMAGDYEQRALCWAALGDYDADSVTDWRGAGYETEADYLATWLREGVSLDELTERCLDALA